MIHYKQLNVWKSCFELSGMIYATSSKFPATEQFGLTQQIRRASVSVISNIAEGCGRFHKNDKLHFFHIARGSLFEVECQLSIAQRLQMTDDENAEEIYIQIQKCMRLLNGFITYHKSKL